MEAGESSSEKAVAKTVIAAIDIEKTGQAGDIISVGIASVWPTGKKTRRLIRFDRPEFPEDDKGPIIERAITGPGPEDVTGVFRDDHGPIKTYGTFEKWCWEEFWGTRTDLLIRNCDWSDYVFSDVRVDEPWACPDDVDITRTNIGIGLVYSEIHRLCKQAVAAGFKFRLVGDNPAYDYGNINALISAAALRFHFEDGKVDYTDENPTPWNLAPPPTLDYLPTGADGVEYNSIRDTARFWAAMKAGLIDEVNVDDVPHTHMPDEDALHVATFYARAAAANPRFSP